MDNLDQLFLYKIIGLTGLTDLTTFINSWTTSDHNNSYDNWRLSTKNTVKFNEQMSSKIP